jgi:protein-S-isoprenylcysteine O-methyltransferase Ste14
VPLKGLYEFRQKIPALAGKKIVILPIYVVLMSTVALFIYLTFDFLPAVSNSSVVIAAFFPLFVILLVISIGFVLVWQMWFWRDRLKEKYGATSYQRIFLVGFGGIAWVLTAAINQYIPYYLYAPTFWTDSPLNLLATPMEAFLGIVAPAILIIRFVIAVVLLLTGLLMIVRAILVFGIDYMVVLYLYFPEDSKIQKNEIYSVLRHPTYAGALLIALGGTLFVFTGFSFIFYLVFVGAFCVHIRFVEEHELIKRFGNSYIDYRKKVPAFFVSPTNLWPFLRFLIKENEK